MTELAQHKCTACHKDAPRVTTEEIAELKPQIPDWNRRGCGWSIAFRAYLQVFRF